MTDDHYINDNHYINDSPKNIFKQKKSSFKNIQSAQKISTCVQIPSIISIYFIYIHL